MDKKEFTPNVEIHLNQVALECDGSKRAIIITDQGSALSHVTLDNLLTGKVTKLQALACEDFDKWGAGKKHYLVDFSNTREEGSYKLSASIESGEHSSSGNFFIAHNALFNLTTADIFRYFVANRHTDERDHAIPVIDTGKVVDVYGGWNDAGGDAGKYLSHLTYSNFFTPQQASFVAWSILSAYQLAESQFEKLKLSNKVLEEAWWGADYLHRVLSDEGYFYMTVFDKWGRDKNRYVTGYKGLDGEYTANYQAAFREGGGLAIAALARAARLALVLDSGGEFTAEQYRLDAVRAFDHLLIHNIEYCDDGKENIIDDYTALLAATELFRTTGGNQYLEYARSRAESLVSRISPVGYLIADDGGRPYYHAVEAGFPLISLLHYYEVESDKARQTQVLSAITRSLEYQIQLDSEVANPYSYPRQNFQTYDFKEDVYTSEVLSGFFIPHENETGYWWQGENARLASLAAAATLAGNLFKSGKDQSLHILAQDLEHFAQVKLDWILGKNPFGVCMLFGHGGNNPEYSESGGAMIKGGISNGITGQTDSAEGRGIDFAAGDEHSNWRWVEQWTPHAAWYLYAVSLGVK